MRLTQFGTYVFPLYNKRDMVSTGDTSGALMRLPGGTAYDGYGTGLAPENVNELTTSFEIIAATPTAVQTERDAIRGRAGKFLRLWAHFPDGTDRFIWARLSKIKMERRREYLYYQPVELTFEVKTPIWNGTGHGATWYLDTGAYLDAGYYLDYDDDWTPASSGSTTTVTNGGNRTVTAVVITVTAGTSQISTIRLRVGSCDWTFNGTVAAGKVLSVDCGTRSIRNNGADAYSSLTLNPGHTVADWFQLAAGNNTVTINYADNGDSSAVVLFTYYDGWF